MLLVKVHLRRLLHLNLRLSTHSFLLRLYTSKMDSDEFEAVICMVCCFLLHGPKRAIECTQDMHFGHKGKKTLPIRLRKAGADFFLSKPLAQIRSNSNRKTWRSLLYDLCNLMKSSEKLSTVTAAICS